MPAVRTSLQEVRRSLIELYAAAGVDPDKPQDVSRRLGINRNLAWKLTKVIQTQDAIGALNYLPGAQGMALALKAFAAMPGAAEAAARVDTALENLDDVVQHHAGSREQLELTLESMGALERDTKMESGREMAYRGNSSVWGIQARARLSTVFLAPHPSGPDKLDYVQINGVLGFRRLNPGVRWRIYQSQAFNDRGLALSDRSGMMEFEPKTADDTPLLIHEFCSPNMPRIETVLHPEGREFILPAGPVGNVPSFDCFFGYIWRGLPAYKDKDNTYGSTAAPISLPVESMIFDLIVHREVRLSSRPEVLVYGFPHGGAEGPTAQTTSNLMNIKGDLLDLPSKPVTVATAAVPQYSQITARVYERMGWNPKDFIGLRVQIPFPPMPSRVVIRWALPEAPGSHGH